MIQLLPRNSILIAIGTCKTSSSRITSRYCPHRKLRPLTTAINVISYRNCHQRQHQYQQEQEQRRQFILAPAFSRRLDVLVSRHDELLKKIEDDPDDGYKHGKELASLSHIMLLNEKKSELESEESALRELLEDIAKSNEVDDDDDEDMIKECRMELEKVERMKPKLEKRIRIAILPKYDDDDNDCDDDDDLDADAIVEIRAGTGGDEATLFASELRDAYKKTARGMKWNVDVMSESFTDLGGIKESVLSISGGSSGGGRSGGGAGGTLSNFTIEDDDYDDDDDETNRIPANIHPYSFFKYESGVHRVQRIPVNDTRIHTSACSVAVLPLKQENDSKSKDQLLPMSELKIETMRSSGPGGQSVNTTDSAIRITHIPTGITASIQDERSQHKNRAKALKLIAARVNNQRREEASRKLGAKRNSLLGSGNRSERIRTYNYPQDRVTDHRCKHTTHGISKLLNGGGTSQQQQDGGTNLVTTFYTYLQNMVYEERVAKFLSNEEERKK